LDIEVFIAPGFPLPALKENSFDKVSILSCYAYFYNYLDFPSGVVPVTKVRKNE